MFEKNETFAFYDRKQKTNCFRSQKRNVDITIQGTSNVNAKKILNNAKLTYRKF
jgi:hypothetical protein